MANTNFTVHNGLTVGPYVVFAGNGDIVTSGNISTTGTGTIASANGFGGLNPSQIYSGSSNVTVTSTNVFANISGIPQLTISSTGVVIAGSLTVSGTTTTVNTETATTINATTVQAVTIGNTGATLTGTLSTASQPNITTLGGVTSIGASSSTTLTGTLQTAAQTNITSVGTLSGLTVSAAIVPNANASVNLGSTTAWWNNIYGTATHALYADLAENYQADKTYAPGTVLMFGGAQEVTVADADTTAVAGVVSTNPAHLMNGALTGANIIPLALTGRVPCMVIGPVKKGDLMVSAGFGYAKTNNSPAVGQVIGKALQEVTFPGKAVIEVVVGRF